MSCPAEILPHEEVFHRRESFPLDNFYVSHFVLLFDLWLFQSLSRRRANDMLAFDIICVALLQCHRLLLLYSRDTCILVQGLVWFRLH